MATIREQEIKAQGWGQKSQLPETGEVIVLPVWNSDEGGGKNDLCCGYAGEEKRK